MSATAGKDVVCGVCGGVFKVKPSHLSRRRFCSQSCRRVHVTNPAAKCPSCGGPRKITSDVCWECHCRNKRDRECSIEGCGRPHLANGLCARHYHSLRNHGDPFAAKVVRGSIDERFWPKVDKNGPVILDTPCWVWTAGVGSHGYGVFQTGKRTIGAHRQSYLLLVGRIPEGLFLDHLCSNRVCVNPDHLEPVLPAENSRRAIKPTCRRGHDLSNAYIRPDTGKRQCRRCIHLRAKGRKDVHIPKAIRAAVMAEAGGRCAYGDCVEASTIDHIIPRADRLRHGISDTDSRYLVAACLTHNTQKSTRHLLPLSWAHRVEEMNELIPGTPWRVWDGNTKSPAYRETYV